MVKSILQITNDSNTLYTVFFLGCLFFYYLICWLLVGRSPAAKAPLPCTEPPQGFSPAKLDYIRNMGFEDDGLNRAFAASLVNMAVKEAVQIQNQDSTYHVINTGKPTTALAPEEQIILTSFFKDSSDIALNRANGTLISKVLDSFARVIDKDCGNIYFIKNTTYILLGLGITLLFILCFVFTARDLKHAILLSFWLTLWTIAVSAMSHTALSKWRVFFAHKEATNLKAASSFTFITTLFLIGEAVGIYFLSAVASVIAAILFAVIISLNIIFYYLLKYPTEKGLEMKASIQGFIQYLITMGATSTMTAELFEKYFSYAIAFQIESEWSHQFIKATGAILSQSEFSKNAVFYSVPLFGTALIDAIQTSTLKAETDERER